MIFWPPKGYPLPIFVMLNERMFGRDFRILNKYQSDSYLGSGKNVIFPRLLFVGFIIGLVWQTVEAHFRNKPSQTYMARFGYLSSFRNINFKLKKRTTTSSCENKSN